MKENCVITDLEIVVNSSKFFRATSDPILRSCVLAFFSKYCTQDFFFFYSFITAFHCDQLQLVGFLLANFFFNFNFIYLTLPGNPCYF